MQVRKTGPHPCPPLGKGRELLSLLVSPIKQSVAPSPYQGEGRGGVVARFVKPWLLGVIVFLLWFGSTGQAEAQETAARPRIGLVLAGGGARGIAHIGVLQWMEEHRIPADRVVGTSMGAVVGGFYAAGLTPREMVSVVQKADWAQALNGRPAFTDIPFRRKQDRRAFPADIEFGLRRGKLQGRTGLNPGHEIQLIFDRALLGYPDNLNFDDLPIPFRCVATDLEAAKPVILSSGSLTLAMRASMAIPGVFTLVERNGLLLADGALMNNVPTDVAKQIGADVIIAIDVSPTIDKNAAQTLTGLLQQSINVMTIEAQRRNLALADVVVTPNLEGFDLFAFEQSQELIRRGYESAAQNAQALNRYALSPEEWRQYINERQARRRRASFVPSFVEVAGAGRNNNLLRQTLRKFVGKLIQPALLETELNRLRGQYGYDRIGYEQTRNTETNRVGLRIQVQEKPYSAPFFYPAFLVEGGTERERNGATFLGRVVAPQPSANGAEARFDVAAGSNQRIAGEYYQPLVRGLPPFVAARASFDRDLQDSFVSGFRVAQYRLDRRLVALDAGFTGPRSELRASLELARLRVGVRVGDPDLPSLIGNEKSAVVRYTYDGADSATVPTSGVYSQNRAAYFFQSPGASSSFTQLETQTTAFFPIEGATDTAHRASLFVRGAAGTNFGVRAPLQQFALGGPYRLTAFNRGEFRADRYVTIGVGYLRVIGHLPTLLGRRVYANGFVERGSFDDVGRARLRSSVSAGVAADTIVGPISLLGGFGDGNRHAIYFTLGRVF